MTIDRELAQHAPFLRALARRLATDQSAAEDLVQETYAAALTGGPRKSHGMLPWLATVLRNRAARSFRSNRRRQAREQIAAPAPDSPDTADVASKLEVARRLMQHVEELSPDSRDIVFLRFYEDLKPKQIAAKLDLPLGTVKTRLARALSKLRERLDADNPNGKRSWLPALCAIGDVPAGTPALISAGATVSRRAIYGWCAFLMLAATVGLWALAQTGQQPGAPIPATVAEAATMEQPVDEPNNDRQPVEALPQIAALIGIVEDANIGAEHGHPAAGVVVRYQFRQPQLASSRAVWAETKTSAQGQFEIEHAQDVEVTSIIANGNALLHAASWSAWNEPGPVPQPLVLTRYLRGVLQGVVVQPSGAPVQGARVLLTHWEDEQRIKLETTCDASGRYVFSDVHNDSWLQAERIGFVQVGASDVTAGKKGGWQPSRIVLAPSGTLHVEIVNSAGQAASDLAGVAIRLSGTESGLHHAMQLGTSRFQGLVKSPPGIATFVVPAEVELMLSTGADIYSAERNGQAVLRNSVSSQDHPIRVAAGEEHRLRIVMGTNTVVQGTVVAPDGQPVAAVDVYFSKTSEHGIEPRGWVTTDARGEFSWNAAGSGRRDVLVSTSTTFAGKQHSAEDYLHIEGVAPVILKLQLVPGHAIVGHVRDANGQPEQAEVRCRVLLPGTTEFTPRGAWTTDEHGTFRIPGYTGMVHRLDVITQNFQTETHDNVHPGDPPIEVVVGATKRTAIRLRIDESSLPIQHLEVRVGYFEANTNANPDWPVLTASSPWSPTAPDVLGGSYYDRRPEGTWRFERHRKLAPVADIVELQLDSGPASLSVSGTSPNGEQLSCISIGQVTIGQRELELPVKLSPTVACRGRLVFGKSSEPFTPCVAFADNQGRLLSLASTGGNAWNTIHAASTHGHFAMTAVPIGVWELRVGTREELERGAARARQQVVFASGSVEPITVRL